MRALRTSGFSALDPLPAKADIRFGTGSQRPGSFQAGAGQYQQPAKLMLIEISDCINEIPVERHARRTYATSSGANNREVLR